MPDATEADWRGRALVAEAQLAEIRDLIDGVIPQEAIGPLGREIRIAANYRGDLHGDLHGDHVNPACGETRVLYPDDEHIDLRCTLPSGHDGPHNDEDMDEMWGEDH